jgi:hypothetical protein
VTPCDDVPLQVLESSRDVEEPLTFEVGAGEMMGNRLFQVGGSAACCAYCMCNRDLVPSDISICALRRATSVAVDIVV